MSTAYKTEVGYLDKEEVLVAEMPRSDFIELVEEAINKTINREYIERKHMGPWLRDELLEVAETMERFPLGQWINASRGCGCLVGEYLIAQSEVDRAKIIAESGKQTYTTGVGVSADSVRHMLAERCSVSQLEVLMDVGGVIDGLVREWVALNIYGVYGVAAVVFTEN